MLNIDEEIKRYMKNGNKDLLSITRTIKSELLNNLKLDDKQKKSQIDVLKSIHKKLIEEIEVFKNANRDTLSLERQLTYVQGLLPQPTSEIEIKQFLDDVKCNNMGEYMKLLKAHFGDRLDGRVASQVIKEIL